MSKEAIEHYEAALKEAFPSGATGDVFHHWNEARKALAEQPAQQEQEPGVAVFELQESGWEIICDGDWIQSLPLRTKLYTSPQAQRKPWVGLTDEQWQSIADTLGCIITRGQKDAIEAKLREKSQ